MKTLKLPPDFLRRPVSINVVGAGGNGSQMVYGLARMHFALLQLGHPHGLHVTLFDPDKVSASNVGRQLYSPADIGQSKATTIIHRVNLFYGLNWAAVPARYGNFRTNPCIVVGCVDSAASRREIAKAESRNWTGWWLDLGNSDRTGQVVLGKYKRILDPQRAAKSADLELECRPPNVLELFPALANKKLKEDDAPSCSMAEALQRQDLFINQTVATFALNLLWTWLRRGELDHHGYFINLEMGRVLPMPIDPVAWQRIRDANKRKPNNSRRRVKHKAVTRTARQKSTLRHIKERAIGKIRRHKTKLRRQP